MRRNKFVACLMSVALMMESLSGMTTPIWAQENNSKLIYDFEKNEEGWIGRGDAKVTRTEKEAKSSKACLYVTNRTANWHGVSKDIVSMVDKGKEYKIGVWVKYDESIADTEQLILTLQHKEEGGEQTNYSQVGQVVAKKGEWSYIEGMIMTPTDLEEAVLYVEARTPELSFYMDKLSIEATGEGIGLQQVQLDIPSLKEIYKDYFKLGTAIVPSDLDESGQQIIRKHFNSITCGNEMKPENVLDYEATIAYMEQNKDDQVHPQISFDNERSINGYTDVNSFLTATQKVEGGYIVELAIPNHLGEFTEGQVIGFEVQVNNDENGNGIRDSVANWNDKTGNGWTSTTDYGVLQLTNK